MSKHFEVVQFVGCWEIRRESEAEVEDVDWHPKRCEEQDNYGDHLGDFTSPFSLH